MQIIQSILMVSGSAFLIALFFGWHSIYFQRVVAAFLAARAEALETQRAKMGTSHVEWKEKLGVKV